MRFVSGRFRSNKIQADIQRLAEFGRVSAGLIHEISTPLTAAALSLDQLHIEQRESKLVLQARRDIRRLEKYLAAARNQLKGGGNMTNFSLTVAIHQVAMLMEHRAERSGVKLLLKTDGSIRLYGDNVMLEQALANLIANAIEACDESSDKPKVVRVEVNKTSKAVYLSVKDNGIGIRQSDLTRVFEPFYSTKSTIGRGIGIGLSVVRTNIEAGFNGQVLVDSNYGHGTIFTIVIPLADS